MLGAPGVPFLFVAAVYLVVATANIALPGVYMDAVNPDYLAVRLLNPAHAPFMEWVLLGNDLLGHRVPLLITVYHGAQTLWFGLPFLWLFGTSVEGLRLTHAMFGLGLLAAFYFCLRRVGVPVLAAAAAAIVLALDPSFSFAFRTQSYITMSGTVWLLLCVALIAAPAPVREKRWLLAGFLAGFAWSAYFVHAFWLGALVPAVLLLTRGDEQRWRARARFAMGLTIGVLPYVVGYWRVAYKLGGWSAFVDFYRHTLDGLGAFASTIGFGERLRFACRVVAGVFDNAWHHGMMFREWVGVPGASLKLALVLGVPIVAWAFAEHRRGASPGARLAIALPAAFVVVALLLGNRLSGHHYVVLVPVVYAAAAVCCRDAYASTAAHHRSLMRGALALTAVVVAAINLAGQSAEARRLLDTGGVGLMSDAINRFGTDLATIYPKPYLLAPDWGLALPAIFLTRGTMSVYMDADPRRVRALRCKGTDIALALIHRRDERRTEWTRLLGTDPARITPYRQRDGTVLFEVAVYPATVGDC